MKRLFLLLLFPGFLVLTPALAAMSDDPSTDAKSADQDCNTCHDKEARMMKWPDGSPEDFVKNSLAKARAIYQDTDSTPSTGTTPTTH